MKKKPIVGMAAVALFALTFVQAAERNKELEIQTKLHRFNEDGFSIYDAFSYVNRIPNGKDIDFPEEPIDTSGRILGRIGNQEGRVQLKLPAGMTKSDYLAFRMFFSPTRFYNDRVGNCGACHAAGAFTDGRKHIVTKGGIPKLTPTLRNLSKPASVIANAIREHLDASRQAKAGDANDIDKELKKMNLESTDVAELVSFVTLLRDEVDKTDTQAVREYFRPLVTSAEEVDVVGADARGEEPTSRE